MAMMLSSGVLLVDALGHAVGTIGNSQIRPRLIIVKEAVKQGMKFSDVMAKSDFFPKEYEGIIEVGEQAGRMAEVFKEMEIRMRKAYEQRLTNLITLIEPLMIIVMGIVVGGIVVVMLMSTISIYDIRL
jgi:general secretion pathway protein F